jgi:hypothetical protein
MGLQPEQWVTGVVVVSSSEVMEKAEGWD